MAGLASGIHFGYKGRMAKPRMSPAAREIEALRASVRALEAEKADLKTIMRESAAFHVTKDVLREAVGKAYDAGLADGFHNGAFAAQCPVDPRHTEAVAVWTKVAGA